MAVKVIECSSGKQIPRMATTRPEFRSTPGDELIVMQALIHVSHHITPDVGRTDDLLFATRIVPVRREPGRVFARSLRNELARELGSTFVR
jgi:hypothetical protein